VPLINPPLEEGAVDELSVEVASVDESKCAALLDGLNGEAEDLIADGVAGNGRQTRRRERNKSDIC